MEHFSRYDNIFFISKQERDVKVHHAFAPCYIVIRYTLQHHVNSSKVSFNHKYKHFAMWYIEILQRENMNWSQG